MNDDASIAEPAAAPTVAAPSLVEAEKAEQSLADGFYPPAPEPITFDVPAHIAELREADARDDPAVRMYGGTADPWLADVFSSAGDAVPASVAKAAAVELTHQARDLGLDSADIRDLVASAREMQARPVDAQKAANACTAALVEAFGDRAALAFETARALVTRDPRTARLLETTGLGNDPSTVVKLARAAFAQKARGRL